MTDEARTVALGAIRVLEVASEGRARMDAASWVRGAHLEPGERLG